MNLLKHYCQRLQINIARRFRQCSLKTSRTAIVRWFASPLGRQILSEEQAILDEWLPEMFGYYLMQLSVLPNAPLHEKSTVGYQFCVEPLVGQQKKESRDSHSEKDKNQAESKKNNGCVSAHFEQLPIDADVIDVAIIHHALEFSTHPHQLLRETTRTLIPNGHIILIGFNPYSLLGIRHTIGRLVSSSPVYRRQRLPVSRLQDWFDVLDLEVVHKQQCVYGLPLHRYCHSQRINRWLKYALPFWGGCYVLVLRKNVTPMTMITSPWKKKSVLPAWQKGVATQTHQQNHSPARQARVNNHEKN